MVPFHVATLKNVKTYDEGNYTFIRFNFITPNQNFIVSNITFPEINGQIIYVQSLVLRGNKELQGISRKIDNKLKEYKSNLQKHEHELDKKETLKYVKDSHVMLDEIQIRPKNGNSKRANTGILQAHKNFMHFVPKEGQKVVVM